MLREGEDLAAAQRPLGSLGRASPIKVCLVEGEGDVPTSFGGASPVKVCLGKDEGDAPLFTGTSTTVVFFSFLLLLWRVCYLRFKFASLRMKMFRLP